MFMFTRTGRAAENRADNLRSLYAMYRLGRRPDQVKYVFMMGDSQDNIAEAARIRGEAADPYDEPALEELWRQRYRAPTYSLEVLRRMQPGSLGREYADHMTRCGLRPDFYDDVEPRHKMHFLRLRVRQTHDIWHVLTGFGTDVAGEVGLQGFYFAQFTNGQSALILVSLILKSILGARYDELERHVEAFCRGYLNGRRARPLLAVKWEDLWQEPVESLRDRFRIPTA